MERTFAGDIEIGFEWMARYGERQWIARRNLVPIQTNSCDLNVLNVNQEGVARKTVANFCVKECDDGEDDQE